MRSIKQSEGILAADFTDGKVILNTETYIPYVLNSTAGLIWDFIKLSRPPEEITGLLVNTYGIDKLRAARDAKLVISGFKKSGLVVLESNSKHKIQMSKQA